VAKLQDLKFYPRDEVENQRLVLYVDRVIGEINPMFRSELEEAADFFQSSMAMGDREVFAEARNRLLITLSQLGFTYDENQDAAGHE
jgi:molecular chaperone HscC